MPNIYLFCSNDISCTVLCLRLIWFNAAKVQIYLFMYLSFSSNGAIEKQWNKNAYKQVLSLSLFLCFPLPALQSNRMKKSSSRAIIFLKENRAYYAQ